VVAYSTVRDYVRDARVRIAAESGNQLASTRSSGPRHPAASTANVNRSHRQATSQRTRNLP
jgi:hypothetical protein